MLLTKDQRKLLDEAVLDAVRTKVSSRASVLLHNDQLLAVLSSLPPDKSVMRYVDGSLQRLRKAKAIVCTDGRWSIVKSKARKS